MPTSCPWAGIAIAIGAMVDASVVMIENAHKKLEAWRHAHAGSEPDGPERIRLIGDAATEVGPALFFALLIITLSFIPIFALEAQEGRLFAPLAYTKTYAMAAAAALSVTVIPVFMAGLIRGRIRDEQANPLNRWLINGYRPVIEVVLDHPRSILAVAVLALAVTAWPAARLGSEFMPPLDEGDLLYMPTALPGLSAGKAAEILQQTDRVIRQFPEVKRVFGIIGRADTATDPAPLEMVDTTVQLRPRSEWRAGMTPERLVEEMDAALQIPGMGNVWVQPIRNRIDMFATGIKSPVGIKIAGPDLEVIGRLGAEIEAVVKTVPGATSAFFERVSGGRYIDVRAGPARRRALWPQCDGRAGPRRHGDRRRVRRADRRRPGTVSDQRALPPRLAGLRREDSPAALRHGSRGVPDAGPDRRCIHRGRTAGDPQRERPPERLDLRGYPRPRPGLLRRRGPRGGGRARCHCPVATPWPGPASSSTCSAPRSGCSSWCH